MGGTPDRRGSFGSDVDGADSVERDVEVTDPRRVGVGVIAAPVAAATLGSGQRGRHDR